MQLLVLLVLLGIAEMFSLWEYDLIRLPRCLVWEYDLIRFIRLIAKNLNCQKLPKIAKMFLRFAISAFGLKDVSGLL